LIDDYCRSLQLRGRPLGRAVPGQIEQVRDWFGAERVGDLTSQRIEEIAEATRKRGFLTGPAGPHRHRRPYALATIKVRLGLLHAVLAHAQRHGALATLPLMPQITVHNARRGLIERGPLEAILRELPAPLDDLARFGAFTGWRAGECRGLTWEHVDLTRGTIQFWPGETKTGAGRVRPIFEADLKALLARRWKARALGCPYVFHRAGRPITDSVLDKAWVRARSRAGSPQALFHDLRRTAYADLIGGVGLDLVTAMELVGHKALSTAARYNVVDTQRMVAGLAKLEAYRAAQLATLAQYSHNDPGMANDLR
jgi:integrase